MIRVENLDAALHFYRDLLGLKVVSRSDHEQGRFTLVFLCAPEDEVRAKQDKAPMVELTHNWPDAQGKAEKVTGGRNFGHLAYRVENIYEVCRRFADAGVTVNRPPRDGHMAFVRSPEGISIELLQAGAPLPPAEPWKSMANTGQW